MRKLLAITGIRSEYDIAYPVLRCLKQSAKYDVSVVVSGAHLSDLHDFSAARIEEDGFRVADRIDSLVMTNGCSVMIPSIKAGNERRNREGATDCPCVAS